MNISSNSLNAAGVNLEVPIEMFDHQVYSPTGAPRTFERSRTSLNTDDYDGNPVYYFEIVASNVGGASSVDIVDSTGSVRGGIAIPAAAGSYTRYRTSFTPNVGGDQYRVRLQNTASVNDVKVATARMLVQQTNATKTKIYVPLLSDVENAGFATDGVTDSVDSNNSLTYINTAQYFSYWYYDPSAWSGIDTSNPFTFEVVTGISLAGQTSSVSLFDLSPAQVTNSVVSTTLAAPTFLTTNLSYTDLSPANIYWVKFKTSNVAQTAYVHKAGLWIRMNNIIKGEVYYRVGWNAGSAATFDSHRMLYDATRFSNPIPYFEVTTSNGTSTNFTLFGPMTATSGLGGGSSLAASTIASTIAVNRFRSPALSLSSGSNYVFNSSGANYSHGALVPVAFQK